MASSRFCTTFILPVTFGILTLGCADRVVDPKTPAIGLPASATPDVRAGEGDTDALAKGLALALGDDATRLRVRDDLRDSPYRAHALHLASYLRGANGSGVAAKAAAGLGIKVDKFLRMAESTPNLELVMPRPLDRTTWEGGAEIDVTATTVTLKERKEAKRISERGYDVRGNAKAVVTLSYSPGPYMIVRPAELAFPTDPEAVRAGAPRQDRNTVTTPAEERALMAQRGRERAARENAAIAAGGPTVRMIMLPPPDDGGGGGSPPPPSVGGGGATLSSAMTRSYCYGLAVPLNSYSDRDFDLVRDDCEAALAQRLAPLLNIGNWDHVPLRQPYWSLSRHPLHPDNLQIIYALAYLADGGYLWGIGAHSGDSEFIILEVKNTSGSNWGIIEATLSAHFGAEEGVAPQDQSGADSYYWDDLDYPQGPFPRIWSSLDKHANYRNRAACEGAGASYSDSCGGDYIGTQIYAPASRNLGNFYHSTVWNHMTSTQLLDCTRWEGASFLYSAYRTADECLWRTSNDRFSGWNPAKPDLVTPYWRIFKIFGF